MKAIPQSYRCLSRCNWLVFMAFPGVMFASLALSENIPRSERIIINADERNALTTVSNLSNSDYSIEAWVESEQGEKVQPSPFIVMPAIFKVRSGEEQVMRIIKTPGKLPDYRESLFYFHIQKNSTISEPGEPEHTEVSRASIKLIYRPGGLPGTPEEAPKKLRWESVHVPAGSLLRVTNPTAYHIHFVDIYLTDGSEPVYFKDLEVLPPGASKEYFLQRKLNVDSAVIKYSAFDDYGVPHGFLGRVKKNPRSVTSMD